MKIKLTIALVVLALVLGTVLIACDDGEFKPIPEAHSATSNETILDRNYLGTGWDADGKGSPIGDTTGNSVGGVVSGFVTPP